MGTKWCILDASAQNEHLDDDKRWTKWPNEKWRVANRRLEIEYANTLQRSRMVLNFFCKCWGFMIHRAIWGNMFLKCFSRWLDVISANQRVHESPPRNRLVAATLHHDVAVADEKDPWCVLKGRPGVQNSLEKSSNENLIKLAKLIFTCTIHDRIFLTELDYYILISVTELVSLQVTSHNWLSTYNRWCRTILLNWRCKIPANSSNIAAWWILCKSAWFERCTNIGNIYPWNTTQDARSSTLDLVKKAKGWKFHPTCHVGR